jgi:hypothetical protein
MAKPALSDIQYILLAAAAHRPDGSLLPWPQSLKGHADAVPKAVASLLRRRLIAEIEVERPARARRSVGRKYFGLMVTQAGGALVLAERRARDEAPAERDRAAAPGPVSDTAVADPAPALAPTTSGVRPGTKQALLIDLLRSEAGASIADLALATGWLPHTTRAALTGLRKRGYIITQEKVEGTIRYRVTKVEARS